MLKYFPLLVVILAHMVLSGCDIVMVEHPVGTPIDDVEGKKLDGTWLSADAGAEDEIFQAKYVGQRRLVVAYVIWNEDQERFLMDDVTVLLTRLENKTYAWLHPRWGNHQEQYLFGRYELNEEDGRLSFRQTSTRYFKAAIRREELEGIVVT